jgi:pyridoxal phosphate enzyme (YggS family)
MEEDSITEKYLALRRSIPSHVAILFACKNASDAQMAELLSLDDKSLVFGENYVQDALSRSVRVPRERYHFIGHLQSNKAREALRLFGTIQGVDSEKLAKKISKIAGEESMKADIYIQVNLDRNPGQSGFAEEGIDLAISHIRSLPNVRLAGIMTMGAIDADRKEAVFSKAKSIAKWNGLLVSMGMSGDYALAIEKGSDLVRIGRKLV